MLYLLFHHLVSLFLVKFGLFVSVWLEINWFSIELVEMFSKCIECFIDIFGCDRWADSWVLQLELYKFFLILAIRIILEPIIQEMRTDSPSVINFSGILDTDCLNLAK